MKEETIYQEQKKLVLIRLKTLNPETKIMMGTRKNVSIQELINHVEQGDDFGKKIIRAQMHLLKIQAGLSE